MAEPGQEENENAKRDKEEGEYRKRHQYREGQTQLEVISTSTEKHQLLDAGRTFMSGFEDMSLHPDGSVSEYRLEDAIAVVGNRAADMSYSHQDLVDLGYLVTLKDPRTGRIEERLTFPGFGYTTEIQTVEHSKKIMTAAGVHHHTEIEEEQIQVFVAGTDNERETLHRDLHQVQSEMTAREDLVKKARWVWGQTENLEGLVQFYFMGSVTAEAMNDLNNAEGRTMPSEINRGERVAVITKTEGGAEYRKEHELGDAKGVASQCFEIAALSEKPAELEALLKTPGIKFLFNVSDQEIDDLFLRPEQRKNADGTERVIKETLVNWIGKPWAWKKEIRSGKKDLEKPVFKMTSTGEVLDPEGVRGRLTARGNILCESSWSDAEDIFKQVERFLGGGENTKSSLAKKDARDARFLAWEELRTTGEASDLGGQIYHYEKDEFLKREAGDYVIHDMGGMTSCDRVKVIAPNVFRNIYRYLKTEIRGFGPDGSLGKYPDRFTVPYNKTWVGMTEHGKRTFQEMKWGHRKGKEVDLLTGREVELPEEKAYRPGELPWTKLSPKAFNAAALGPFIAGREKIGIFQNVMRTDFQIHELKDKAFFEKLAQYVGISFNLQTVRDGKLRGIYNGDPVHDANVGEKTKDLVRNYKKQFFTAFWDGIRSLPQYREWVAAKLEELDSSVDMKKNKVQSVQRIKYHLRSIGIFTDKEVDKLETKPLITKGVNDMLY